MDRKRELSREDNAEKKSLMVRKRGRMREGGGVGMVVMVTERKGSDTRCLSPVFYVPHPFSIIKLLRGATTCERIMKSF